MTGNALDTAGERMKRGVGSRPKAAQRVKAVLGMLVNVSCFALLWELVARYSGVPSMFLPRFSSILEELSNLASEGILLPNLLASLRVFGIGLAIGLALGLPLAYAVGMVRRWTVF